MVQTAFNEVLAYSQGLPEVNTDKLFEIYNTVKSPILHRMGDYIIEFPNFCFDIPHSAKRENFIEFHERMREHYELYELADFIWSQGVDAFYNNTTVYNYGFAKDPNKIIPKGMRLVKAFKYFIEDLDLRSTIQDEASRLIQNGKVCGTLCVSIHPLDFLSLSENTSNWRSCHALDGEYRAGNLSYMTDSTTVICYLKSNDLVQLPHFPKGMMWNNKKWRCLFYVNSAFTNVFASRPYPFAPDNWYDLVRPALFSALKLNPDEFTAWDNTYISTIDRNNGKYEELFKTYVPVFHKLYQLDSIVQDGEGSQQYNDVLYSTFYKSPYYTYNKWAAEPLNPTIVVGGAVPCICCGQEIVDSHEDMTCSFCRDRIDAQREEEMTWCSSCDSAIPPDIEVLTTYDGEYVCPWCAENYYDTCSVCGHLVRSQESIYVASEGRTYCPDCISYNRYKGE